MRLSFDDKESLMEVAGSLRFNNPPSDPNSLGQVGSTSILPQERSEDRFDNPSEPKSSDPNIVQ